MTHEAPVVVFDGKCEFCKGAVAFIRHHDRKDLMIVPPRLRVSATPLSDGFGFSDNPPPRL